MAPSPVQGARGRPSAAAHGPAAFHPQAQGLPKELHCWPASPNSLAWRWPGRRRVLVCVCLTEVEHLPGRLCNLIPQGENFFLISACDQILPWSIRLKCPCNFHPEERQTDWLVLLNPSQGSWKWNKFRRAPWCGVSGHGAGSPSPRWKTGWKAGCSSTALNARDFIFRKSNLLK